MHVESAQAQSDYQLSDFEVAVQKVDTIETMPVVAQRLIALTGSDDCSMDKLQTLVQSDPVIAAKILRVASSPFYGSRPASNLRAALIRIGMRDLRKLVMASAMISSSMNKFTKELWGYSLKVAAIGEAIASLVRTKDLEDPFLCGLLHDFGSVVMNQVLGKRYREVVPNPGSEAQQNDEVLAFGFDHCDLGVMVAQSWKLFEALEHVMQHHHHPLIIDELGLPDASRAAVFVVALARQAALGLPEESAGLVAELCERMALSAEELEACRLTGLQTYEDMYSGLLSTTT